MFSTIVIGFDGSSRGLDALALAEALAAPETELVVCCVRPPAVYADLVSEGDLREKAHQRLQAARSRLGDRPHTRFEIREAFSAGAGLHDEAERSHADLIVVGASHRSGVGRIFPGSVTRQVLHAPPCAVAVAPHGLHLREEPAIREIGVAFDGGPESRVALDAAAAMVREHHARLRVITVVEPELVSAGWASAWVYPEVRDELRRAAETAGREALEALGGGIEASLDVVEGIPAEELVLASARLDLLVMGSRGYGPIRRALLGTVSSRVADSAACAVLIVPRGASAPDDGQEPNAAAPADEQPS
jgi:nucleotide-binding universal stress UspA family protein